MKDEVRRSYDRIAETYAAESATQQDKRALDDAIVERLPDDAQVLDAGCGDGRQVTVPLSDRFDVVGVDFSAKQLALARANEPSAEFVQGDMTALGFTHEVFDAVCAFHSIIHAPTEEHPRVINGFSRLLKPGGLLLISLGVDAWEGTNPNWLDTGTEMHWSFPDLDTSRKTLEKAGFDIIRERTVGDELGGSFVFVLAKKRT